MVPMAIVTDDFSAVKMVRLLSLLLSLLFSLDAILKLIFVLWVCTMSTHPDLDPLFLMI
jgi:hypothetical protein